MVTIVGVRFRSLGKVYYFSPEGFDDLKIDDPVIVETARGTEYGVIALKPTVVKHDEIVQPLKNIVRRATAEDTKKHLENESKKGHAIEICQEKIIKHNLDMKLIDVEYTFDNNKIIFYFTSDGRVDFRDLVKDLASVFRMRIELRQIGVRDEAKIIGGIGSCGRSLCCASWLSDFQPVSIKMAKIQNLSLNPTKISGVCGRLMCCLKYENDTYTMLRKGMPEVGEIVKTKEGKGKVVDTNLLAGLVKIRFLTGEKDEDGQDKLSSDIHVYPKEIVKRLNPRKSCGGCCNQGILDDVDDELKSELEALIKE